MTATVAPRHWPSPAGAWLDGGWRFARVSDAPASWQFDLRRNVSITPRQLLLAYLLLCAVSLTVAAGFWWHGAGMVMVFAGIELLAVAVALLMVARHAGDRELLTVNRRELTVAQQVGPELLHTRFRTEWVRIEPAADDGSLLELSGEGRRVHIGRHLRPELRPALAEELRRALRLARAIEQRTEDQDNTA